MGLAFADPPPRTLAEFLHQEPRYKWDGVQPVAMTGGTVAHSDLASRLYDLLPPPGTALRLGDIHAGLAEGEPG